MKSYKLEDTTNPYAGDWITFIIDFPQVIEVHSTGIVRIGNDDRNSIQEIIKDAFDNQLHSQAPSNGGTRFLPNAEFAVNSQPLAVR